MAGGRPWVFCQLISRRWPETSAPCCAVLSIGLLTMWELASLKSRAERGRGREEEGEKERGRQREREREGETERERLN